MVISLDNKPRKIREWYKKHVYAVYKFRILYEQRGDLGSDPRKKKAAERKMKHLQKKIEQHMSYGEFLGLSGEEMREFNLVIVEETRKGKSPRVIIQALTGVQKQ